MISIEDAKNKVIAGGMLTKADALALYEQPLDALCKAANEIRTQFCGTAFDLCAIINGKSGQCSEDCKFCAQSSHHPTDTEEYPLLSAKELVDGAKHNQEQGVLRYSIVTSGKRLSDAEVDAMCHAVRQIREAVDISICISFGLLDEAQYTKLKAAGVTRVHNNLETSRRNFPQICTTHGFEDKIAAIQAAQAAGLCVCSGGIFGLGETVEDRIDMALTLRDLGIQSVPINLLNPIMGTPLEGSEMLSPEEMQRMVALYRFLLPTAAIRLAGGRGLFEDKGAACFVSGANAAISGDMLTTSGITVETDQNLIQTLGYEVKPCHG